MEMKIKYIYKAVLYTLSLLCNIDEIFVVFITEEQHIFVEKVAEPKIKRTR